MNLYRMHDASPAGVFPVADRAEAKRWNEQGHGVFWTVNSFDGARRRENLTKINAWAIDIDDGTKVEQRARLLKSPLVPSLIVETKRGFQAYWIAKQAKPEHWNAIVLERLVPAFGADKNARDLCRILRVPGFLHLKDPQDPFLVTVVWKHDVGYTERQVAESFRWVPDRATQKATHDDARRAAQVEVPALGESLWDAIYALDCEEGLRRLSGHGCVGGEQYTFRATARGRLNILVDGKGSPCFIDENKRIGSPSGGGPTLVQWIRWFGRSYKETLDVLKELFPRLAEIDAAARKAWSNQQRRAS